MSRISGEEEFLRVISSLKQDEEFPNNIELISAHSSACGTVSNVDIVGDVLKIAAFHIILVALFFCRFSKMCFWNVQTY
jgi:hypothetical protein